MTLQVEGAEVRSMQRFIPLLDAELFVPEQWFEESYKDKRKNCRFPEQFTFKTKPQLAVKILERVEEEESLPFKYVVADSI